MSSGFRSTALNKLVGGAKNSQHLTGEAADITSRKVTVTQLFRWIVLDSSLPFDQVIWEFGGRWVHVSAVVDGTPGRHALVTRTVGRKTQYDPVSTEQVEVMK